MITITIKTGNAAFLSPDGKKSPCERGFEVGRILHKLASEYETTGDVPVPPRDANGNVVGTIEDKDTD